MSCLKEKILKSKGLSSVVENVPEFDGLSLELREFTGTKRILFQESVVVDEKGRVNLIEYYATAIVLGAHDPETGELVFTLDDREALYEKGFRVIERLGKKILDMSGIGKDAESGIEKNSASGAASD